MTTNIKTRIISLVLVICLAAGVFPMVAARALELEDGTFNLTSGQIEIDFQLQYTQNLTIEVLVEGGNGTEHFGYLLKNEWTEGYDGAIALPKDPCNMDSYADKLPAVYAGEDAGTAVNGALADGRLAGGEFAIEEQEGKGAGYYTIYWTGSINGQPVVNMAPDSDTYTVIISIQPKGDLSKGLNGVVPCSDPGNGIHDGEDWTWTRQYHVETEFVFKYDTILTTDGLSEILLRKARGDEYDLVMEQILGMSNWINHPMAKQIYENAESLIQDHCDGDPVNMIDGSYVFTYTDLQLEGQFPLSFTRAYNSRGRDGSLGKGFTHSFDYRLAEENGYAHVYLPGGEEMIFLKLRPSEANDYYTVGNNEFTLWDTASGGHIMRFKRGAEYEFDASGQLTEIRNEQGTAVYTLSYSGDELQKIDRVTGGAMSFVWENGNIVSVTDSSTVNGGAGRSVSYGYDNDGRLISVTNPDGDTLTYGYADDGTGYITSATDFEGEAYLKNKYDAKGRVTEQVFTNANVDTVHRFIYDDANLINTYINPDGHEKKYAYDEYRNLMWTEENGKKTLSDYSNYVASTLVDAEGNETAFNIDSSGNVTKMTYADGTAEGIAVEMEYGADNLVTAVKYSDGSFEKFLYDGQKRLATYQDRNGNQTKYNYEGPDNYPGSVTDALGNTTVYSYTNGSLTSRTDAEGGVTSYTYDDVGRITSVSVKIDDTPTFATTSYQYSAAGKLEAVTDALGNRTEYTYNKNGFTTGTADALGNVSATEYGTNGQPLSVTDALGNTTTYIYEEGTARLRAIEDPEGNRTAYAYNKKDQLVSVTDASGGVTTYEYDSLDRIIRITDALGGTTEYEYDSLGRTDSVTDANGNATAYGYDKDSRLVKVTDALGGVTAYTYDAAGNLLSATDANGNTTYTEYDAVNRAVKTIDAMGHAASYVYDNAGRLLSVTDAEGGVTSYTYDLAGRMTAAADPNGNTAGYEYDLLGRVVRQTNADGTFTGSVYDALGRVTESFDELNNKTAYSYNANGNVVSVKDPLGHVTGYAYDGNGRVTAITCPDGGIVGYTYTPLGQTETYTDQNGNITAYAYDALGRTRTVTDAENGVAEYFYDAVGNMTRTEKDGNIISGSAYDGLGRVVTATDGLGSSASYTYDAVGNVLVYTDKNGNGTAYTYDKNDRLLSTTDAMGFTRSQSYDKLGRVTSSTDKNGNATEYTYDANGNTLDRNGCAGRGNKLRLRLPQQGFVIYGQAGEHDRLYLRPYGQHGEGDGPGGRVIKLYLLRRRQPEAVHQPERRVGGVYLRRDGQGVEGAQPDIPVDKV